MSIQVHVTGTSPAAAKLREYLGSLGYTLSEGGARYSIQIDCAESEPGKLVLEGTRGALAEETQHAVAELSGATVEWQRSTIGNEGHLRLVSGSSQEDAAARGALRAILRLTRHGERRRSFMKAKWFETLRGNRTK